MEFEFKHISLIEDKSIDVKTLPKEVKQKMQGWNLQFSKLKKSPTENLGKSLERTSSDIATAIETHLEASKTPAPPITPPKTPEPPKMQTVQTPPITPPAPITPPITPDPPKTNGTKSFFELLFGH